MSEFCGFRRHGVQGELKLILSWIETCLQTFYPLVARAELPEDAMPLEFMQDRRLDFVDYSKLKPFTVSIIVLYSALFS